MDDPDNPGGYLPCWYLVCVGTSLLGLRLALANSLGTRLVDAACLLFTPEGARGEFLDRDTLAALDLPDSAPSPYIAIVRTDLPEVMFRRLAWMTRSKLGWAYAPHFISETDVWCLFE